MTLGQLKRDSLLQVMVMAASYLAGFLLSALVGRALGPADLGAWSATAALSSMVIGFATLGIDNPLARRIAVAPEEASRWLGNGLALRLFVSLPLSVALVVLLSMTANRGVVSAEFALLYALYAGFGGILGLLGRVCQVLQRFSWQLLPVVLGTLPALAVGYWRVTRGGGLLEVVLCVAAGQFLGVLVLGAALRRLAAPWPRFDRSDWRDLLVESWPLAVSAPFLAAYARVDTVLLVNLKGPEAVGLYSAAYAFYMAFGGLASAVQSAMFPAIARIHAESPGASLGIFKRGLRWMLGMGLAGIAGTFLLGRWVLTLVYGDGYFRAGDALLILMCGAPFWLLNCTYGMALNAIGQQKANLKLTLIGLVTNVGANLYLIPSLDVLGAALATVVTEAVVLAAAHAWLMPHFRVRAVEATA